MMNGALTIGGDELFGPGPAGGDAQVRDAGGPSDLRGDVQQPVTQFLRLGQGQRSVEQQVLGPGEQVDAGQSEFEPGGVDREHP
jgi:hypothetical protein